MNAVPDFLAMHTFDAKLSDGATAVVNVTMLNPYADYAFLRLLRSHGYTAFGTVLIEALTDHPEEIELIWAVEPDDSVAIWPAPHNPQPDKRAVNVANNAVYAFFGLLENELDEMDSEQGERAPKPTLH